MVAEPPRKSLALINNADTTSTASKAPGSLGSRGTRCAPHLASLGCGACGPGVRRATRPLSFPPWRLFGPAHPCRLDRSAHPCRLDRSAHPCRLDRPAHPNTAHESHPLPSRLRAGRCAGGAHARYTSTGRRSCSSCSKIGHGRPIFGIQQDLRSCATSFLRGRRHLGAGCQRDLRSLAGCDLLIPRFTSFAGTPVGLRPRAPHRLENTPPRKVTSDPSGNVHPALHESDRRTRTEPSAATLTSTGSMTFSSATTSSISLTRRISSAAEWLTFTPASSQASYTRSGTS